jgi:hypothetical protein
MFHGSYQEDDVTFLLKPVELGETALPEKEKLIQSGKRHYSEMISAEYAPSAAYLDVFYRSLPLNKEKMAQNIVSLAAFLARRKNLILVSLARAGTPVGVLLKRTLRDIFDKNVPHYSVSIIRDRGIDKNALKYILSKNAAGGIAFIDGWTGKGVISRELKESVSSFNRENNCTISADLHVLADISGTAEVSVTNEDYLIPSSVLNATISGLISRTILNDAVIGPDDFHGCKYYTELSENDLSLWFIETMISEIKKVSLTEESLKVNSGNNTRLQKISGEFIKFAMTEYNIRNLNYLKPGIGETTRVLLRRVPDKILVRDINLPEIEHLMVLAKEKGVPAKQISDMPYKAAGIISDLER